MNRLLIAALFIPHLVFALAPPVVFTVKTNGAVDGPYTVITTGSTTSGLNEAINAAITAAAASTISNGPTGGAIIQLGSGFYDCTGQILLTNKYPNPIHIVGVQSGPSAGTIIRYRGTTNLFQTTQPSGTGMLSLWLENLTVTSMQVATNFLFRLTDVYQLRGDHCLFAGWGYFTNQTFSGFIGNTQPVQGTGLVAFYTGDFPNDYSAGVIEFNDCRFWGLAGGVVTTTDHQFVTDCSFALIGGPSKDLSLITPSLWPVGVSYHFPESALSQYAGWINNSSGGDVLFRGRWSTFNTRVAYIHAGVGILGAGPTFIIDSEAQLESAAYLVLEYDDLLSTSQNIHIYAPGTPVTRSGISTITKPGTTTGVLPPNVRFHGHGLETLGETNLLYFARGDNSAVNNAQFPTSKNGGVGSGPTTLMESGDIAGRTIIRGTNYLDHLETGVSIDLITPVVTGGTDSGINSASSAYKLKGRIAANGFVSFVWTNATYAILQADGDSGYGGIYLKSDTTFSSELYYNATPTTLGPDYYVAAAGVYAADTGVGTPPTVTFTMTTNIATFFGGLHASYSNYTSAATTRTMNTWSGKVLLQSGNQVYTVTDSYVSTASSIIASLNAIDSTATNLVVVPGSGSFTLNVNKNATANLPISWWIVHQ
jgi:hypothetical protein